MEFTEIYRKALSIAGVEFILYKDGEVIDSNTARALPIYETLKSNNGSNYEMRIFNAAKYTDSKTGLLNTECLKECLKNPIYPVSYIFCDIDNFKDINTKFNHTNADQAINDIATILKSNVHKINYSDEEMAKAPDYVAHPGRFGGDEFLIALSNADEEVAIKVANRLCSLIKKHLVITPTCTFNISMTFSVATAHNKEELNQLASKVTSSLIIGKGDKKSSKGQVVFTDVSGKFYIVSKK